MTSRAPSSPASESYAIETGEFSYEFMKIMSEAMHQLHLAQIYAKDSAEVSTYRLKEGVGIAGEVLRTRETQVAEQATVALALTVAMASAARALYSPKRSSRQPGRLSEEWRYCNELDLLEMTAVKNMLAAHALNIALCAHTKAKAAKAAKAAKTAKTAKAAKAAKEVTPTKSALGNLTTPLACALITVRVLALLDLYYLNSRHLGILSAPLLGFDLLVALYVCYRTGRALFSIIVSVSVPLPLWSSSTGSAIIEATDAAVAAVTQVIDTARTTNYVTAKPSRGWHMHYDANDVWRLDIVSRLASALASAATTVSSAMRTIDPALSAQASQAACSALDACRNASAMQMEILMEAKEQLDEALISNRAVEGGMQGWLTKLEQLGSIDFHFECKSISDIVLAYNGIHDAYWEGRYFNTELRYELSTGTVVVTSTSGECKECEENGETEGNERNEENGGSEGRDNREISVDTDVSDSSSITLVAH